MKRADLSGRYRVTNEMVDVLIADGFKVTRDDIIRLRDSCRRVTREIHRRPEIPAEYKITGAPDRGKPRAFPKMIPAGRVDT